MCSKIFFKIYCDLLRISELYVIFNTEMYFQIAGLYTVQCNLDLVTLLFFAKSVAKLHNVTKSNDFFVVN